MTRKRSTENMDKKFGDQFIDDVETEAEEIRVIARTHRLTKLLEIADKLCKLARVFVVAQEDRFYAALRRRAKPMACIGGLVLVILLAGVIPMVEQNEPTEQQANFDHQIRTMDKYIASTDYPKAHFHYSNARDIAEQENSEAMKAVCVQRFKELRKARRSGS